MYIANDTDEEGLPTEAEGITSYVEIHTIWRLDDCSEIATAIQETIEDQRQLLASFLDLPVIPFRLETGGVGFINPAKISRVTVYPAFKGVVGTGLPADLLRCVRP